MNNQRSTEEYLKRYYDIYAKAKTDIELNAKTIQEACMEHSSLYLYYCDKLCELKAISTNVQIGLERLKSLSTIEYNEKYSLSLSLQMIGKYVESEAEVVKAKQTLAEVNEILNKFETIKESFISRGYQLNNITKLRVAQIEEGLL